jgi:hypothetical protein
MVVTPVRTVTALRFRVSHPRSILERTFGEIDLRAEGWSWNVVAQAGIGDGG